MYSSYGRCHSGLQSIWQNVNINNSYLNKIQFGVDNNNKLATQAQVDIGMARDKLSNDLKFIENNSNQTNKILYDNLKLGIGKLEESIERYRALTTNDYVKRVTIPFQDEVHLLLAKSYVYLGNLYSVLPVSDELVGYYSRALNYNYNYVVENVDAILLNIEQKLDFAKLTKINKEFLSQLIISVIKVLYEPQYLNLDSQLLSVKNLELKKQQLHLYEILVKLCDATANYEGKQRYINDYGMKKEQYDKNKKLLDIDNLCESATQCYISENYVDTRILLQSAFKLLEEVDDKNRMANLSCLFGLVLVQEENYTQAELYLQKSFLIAKEINNTVVLIDAAFFLGKIYFIAQNNFIAKEKFMEVVDAAPIVRSKDLWGAATYFLVRILIDENNINEAIRLVKPLVINAVSSLDISELQIVLHLCVDICYKLNDYISAASYLQVVNGQCASNDEIINIAKSFIKYESFQPQLDFVNNGIVTPTKQLNPQLQKIVLRPSSKKNKPLSWGGYKTLPKANAIQSPILVHKRRQINVQQPPLIEQQQAQVNVDGITTITSPISNIALLPQQTNPSVFKVKELSATVKSAGKLQKSKFMQKTKLNKLIEIKNDQKRISEIPQWRIKLQKLGHLVDVDKSNNLVAILDENTQKFLHFRDNKQNKHREPRLAITIGEGGKGFKSLKYNLIKIGDLEFKTYEMKKPNVADRVIFIKLGNYLLPYGELKNKDYTRVRKYPWFDDMFIQAQEILQMCS